MNFEFRIRWERLSVFLILTSIFCIPLLTSAQVAPLQQGQCGLLGINCNQNNSPGTLQTYVLAVINVFLGLVGTLAFIFVLLGGVRYIASRGDEGEAEAAKNTILYAVIGIVVIGLAAIVVNFSLGAAGIRGGGLPGGSNLVGAVLTIVNIFLGLVGITALIFVLLGGIRYITSQGDEDRAEEGKRMILYAVIGLVIVGLAAVLVNFVAASIGLSTGIPAGSNLPGAILVVINFFLILTGLTAVIFIIYAGIQYITARGDTDQAETAKRTILYAVIGLIVIGLAAVIVNFVISAFVTTWWYN